MEHLTKPEWPLTELNSVGGGRGAGGGQSGSYLGESVTS